MASKVIGLDIGRYEIKATVLKGTYRGFEVVDFVSRPLPLHELSGQELEDATGTTSIEVSDVEAARESMEEQTADGAEPDEGADQPETTLRDLQLREAQALLDDLDTDDVTVVAAIPSAQVSSWVVEVPFTQPKQIAAILSGVLEERVPFDMDEVLLHQHTLESSATLLDGDPGTRLFCAMARKAELRTLLKELGTIGVDPRHLPVDAGALANLVRFLPQDSSSRTVVLLDVGHRDTKLCAMVDGVPLLLRTIDWGGRDIDASLQSRYRFELGEVGDYKHRMGTLSGASTEESVQAMVGSLREATNPLVAQLRTTLMAFEDEQHREVDSIYVCGGGSELRGFCPHLSRELGVTVEDLPLPPSPGDVPDAGAQHALAYALALRGLAQGRGQQVGFRSDEFAYRRDIQRIQRLGLALTAAVLLIALGGMALAVYNAVTLSVRERALMEEIRGTVQGTFPGVAESALVTSSSSLNVFIAEMDTLNAKVAQFDPENQTTAFDLLKEFSTAVPKEHKIDVDNIDISSEAIKLRANTDKFETVDKIEAAVKRNSLFALAAAHDKVKGRESTTRFEMTIPLGVEEE
jgi:Tfp pilus assembly PilM family ATPase